MSKEQAGNYDPGEVVRKRAAASGQRKVASRYRLRQRQRFGGF
jgi:hypothetical protein